MSPKIKQLQVRHFILFYFLPFLGFVLSLALLWYHPISWIEISLLLGFWFLSSLGITVGYHRLFAHKGFKASPLVRAGLAVLGSMAGNGPLLSWVAEHRRHHEHSDRPGDPHSPHLSGEGAWNRLRGLWHAHLGWMLGHELPLPQFYVADLLRDEALVRVARRYYTWVGLGLVLPAVIGGLLYGSLWGALSSFLWGGPARMFVSNQLISSINSICHTFGRRPFDTPDGSRNNLLIAIPTLGEGWHNNHHAFPSSAFLGLRWWEIDIGAWMVRMLSSTGLAWDVVDARQSVHARTR